MKKLAILVHGLNTRIGVGKLEVFRAPLQLAGFDVEDFRYGFFSILDAFRKDNIVSRSLAARIIEGYLAGYDEVHVIGHSNGCALMEKASTYIRTCHSYTYLAPALRGGDAPERVVRRVNVWFNKQDGLVKLAAFLRHIPEVLLNRVDWGTQGVTGYTGHDPRIKNFEVIGHGLNKFQQHSAFYFNKNVYVPRIIEAIK